MNTSKFCNGVMYCINPSTNEISSFSTAGDYINQPLFDAGFQSITISELYDKFGLEEQELACVGYLVNEYGSGYGTVYCKEICNKYQIEIPEETDIYDQVQVLNTIEDCKAYFGSEGFSSNEAFSYFMSSQKEYAQIQ